SGRRRELPGRTCRLREGEQRQWVGRDGGSSAGLRPLHSALHRVAREKRHGSPRGGKPMTTDQQQQQQDQQAEQQDQQEQLQQQEQQEQEHEEQARQEARRDGEQDGQDQALCADDEAQSFRSRWEDVQRGFVDEPRE